MRINPMMLCFMILVTVPYSLYAQMDTVGFPFEIGNKWYYRYTNARSTPPSDWILVKTIVDTTADSVYTVQNTRLGQDSVVIGTEIWRVTDGSFFVNSLCLYDASLTHDSSWYNPYIGGGNEGSILLRRDTVLGNDSRCQIRSTHNWSITFAETWTERRVALGLGRYFDHDHGYGGETGWNYSSSLIGILKNGVLYGDTLTTDVILPPFGIPDVFEVSQNYPNPFNPTTNIRFSISESRFVSLKVFDLLGVLVATLVNDVVSAGRYEVSFDATRLASGIYIYRLQSENLVQSRSLLLLK